MTIDNILQRRLQTQQLAAPEFKTAGEVVHWLGAVQAQDHFGSLWAIGQRMKKATENSIDEAVANKSIVRSYPMRGTIHYAPSDDLRWMQQLLSPRILSRASKVYRDAGLDASTFKKSAKIFEKILRGGNQLTRNELYEALAKNKISTNETRGLHMIGHAALEGLLCFGSRKGKQPTLTLLDEWLPATPSIKKDEAIARLTFKYFRGHGPATAKDFSWWSGLTLTEAKRGIEMVGDNLVKEVVGEHSYWYVPSDKKIKPMSKSALLLPVYDEYIVGYENRSDLVHNNGRKSSNENKTIIFTNTLVIGGRVAGNWKRTINKENVLIEIKPLTKLSVPHQAQVLAVAKKYGKFFNSEATVKYHKK